MKPVRHVLIGLLLLTACSPLTACSSHGTATPAASPTVPAGSIARILCRTHRTEIQANEQALTVDVAAGDTAAADALRAKIRADIATARALQGCNVDDLPIP